MCFHITACEYNIFVHHVFTIFNNVDFDKIVNTNLEFENIKDELIQFHNYNISNTQHSLANYSTIYTKNANVLFYYLLICVNIICNNRDYFTNKLLDIFDKLGDDVRNGITDENHYLIASHQIKKDNDIIIFMINAIRNDWIIEYELYIDNNNNNNNNNNQNLIFEIHIINNDS